MRYFPYTKRYTHKTCPPAIAELLQGIHYRILKFAIFSNDNPLINAIFSGKIAKGSQIGFFYHKSEGFNVGYRSNSPKGI